MVACAKVEWIPLAQDRIQWRAVVTTIVRFCVPDVSRRLLRYLRNVKQVKLTRRAYFKSQAILRTTGRMTGIRSPGRADIYFLVHIVFIG